MNGEDRAVLVEARDRLEALGLYPTPIPIDRVRMHVVPAVFKLPGLRRFDGFATHRRIVLRRPPRTHDSLVVHELCHVWQMQHHPVRMPLSYLWHRYERNPWEREARAAASHALSP